MKEKLIISVAVDAREAYVNIQKGLIKTLGVAKNCDYWIVNSFDEGITPHTTTPYLFKFDLIQKAVNLGFKKIMWADSTMRLLKDPFELLEQSKKGIVAFENIGHLAHRYLSDKATWNLRKYWKDEDELYEVKQMWGGCFLLDFTKPYAEKFLKEMFEQAAQGSFDEGNSDRSSFVAHRHDQVTGSYILNFYKIPLLEYGIIAATNHVTNKTYIEYGR